MAPQPLVQGEGLWDVSTSADNGNNIDDTNDTDEIYDRFVAPQPLVRGEGLWDVSSESMVACPQVSHFLGSLEICGNEK